MKFTIWITCFRTGNLSAKIWRLELLCGSCSEQLTRLDFLGAREWQIPCNFLALKDIHRCKCWQFFHCSLKSKMFSFTNLKMSSPLIIVCKSLQNKYSFTNFPSFMNRIKASSWALPLMSLDSSTWKDHNRDNSSPSALKCSQIWSFKSDDKSLIQREIVFFDKG